MTVMGVFLLLMSDMEAFEVLFWGSGDLSLFGFGNGMVRLKPLNWTHYQEFGFGMLRHNVTMVMKNLLNLLSGMTQALIYGYHMINQMKRQVRTSFFPTEDGLQ